MRPIIVRETSLSAMCGRLRVGKDVLHSRRLRSNDEWSPVGRDFGQLTLLRLLRSPIGTKRTGPSCVTIITVFATTIALAVLLVMIACRSIWRLLRRRSIPWCTDVHRTMPSVIPHYARRCRPTQLSPLQKAHSW